MGLLSLMRSAGTSGETLTEAEHNAAMHQVGGADDLSAYYARLGAAVTFTDRVSATRFRAEGATSDLVIDDRANPGTANEWAVYATGGSFFWYRGANLMSLTTAGIGSFASKVRPGTDAGAIQTACGLYAGSGAPNNANGADGDIYLRSDGGALTTVYQRRAGAWVGVV